jgi:hypothetical protein
MHLHVNSLSVPQMLANTGVIGEDKALRVFNDTDQDVQRVQLCEFLLDLTF